MNKIAPNNNLPATHFIEVWKNKSIKDYWIAFDETDCYEIQDIDELIAVDTKTLNYETIAIFRIRENKLPTIHKF